MNGNVIQNKATIRPIEQKDYHLTKSHCGRKRKLEIDTDLSQTIKHLFLDCQWSPEEIEGRLRLERGKPVISYQTIYRGIYRVHFDAPPLSRGGGGLVGLFVNFVIVEKHDIPKLISKKEGKFLFLIRFMRDQQKPMSALE